MKTEIHVSFNYGAWDLSFSKEFDLSFTPFYGLYLYEETGDFELTIPLETNDYCRTRMDYNLSDNSFSIDVRNVWKHPVRDDVIDDEIEMFINNGWTRTDRTDVIELKKLMNRNYLESKK